jgi:hypothetical protein
MSCMKNLAVNHLNARALSYQIGGLILFLFHIFIIIFHVNVTVYVREGATSTQENSKIA